MEKEGKFDSSSHLWKLTDITVSGRGNNSESSGERKCGREERKVGEESGMARDDDVDHLPGLRSLSLALQSMHSVVTSGNKQGKNIHT